MDNEKQLQEAKKEIAFWKEKEFQACSKHHEFIDEIEDLEADLKQANALLQWEQDYSEKKHLKNIQLQEKNEKQQKEIESLKDELFESYRMQLKGMVVGGQLDWVRKRMLELED